VAAYLSDFTNTANWDPHTEECVRLDNGPLRTGAHYRNLQKVAGRSSELHYDLVDYRPEEQVKVIGQGPLQPSVKRVGKNVKATDTMIFDAEEGGGTLVTYRAEFVFSGASRFAEPLLKIVLNRVGDDGAEGMRRALERFTDVWHRRDCGRGEVGAGRHQDASEVVSWLRSCGGRPVMAARAASRWQASVGSSNAPGSRVRR